MKDLFGFFGGIFSLVFLVVAFCLILASLLALLGHFVNGRKNIRKFWRWPKGSRKTYYLGSGHLVFTTEARLRLWGETAKYGITGLLIEINRGFWRRPSAIYGDSPRSWQIVGDFEVAGLPWINFQDRRGLPIETALRLINTYPSLQAILDRIAELEELVGCKDGQIAEMGQELATSRLRRQELFAAMLALRQIIDNDKQRYKSPAAKNIASYVGIVIRKAREIDEPEPSKDQVSDWVRFGPNSES